MANDPILNDAAEWLMTRELSGDTAGDGRDAFQEWLEASLAHRNAYSCVERNWQTLDRLAVLLPPSKYRSVEELMAAVQGRDEKCKRCKRAKWVRKRLKKAAIGIVGGVAVAALVVAIIPFLSYRSPQSTEWTRFEATNRPLPVRLDDGSLLYLNRYSQVRVHFTDDRRELALDVGESFFKVSHEHRPFEVRVDTTRVLATGTEFLLGRHPNGRVEAAVREGSVEINSPQCTCDRKQLKLVSGRIATVTANELRESFRGVLGVSHAFDWADTLEVDETLAEAVTQFNWYNENKLEIVNPALTTLKVAGFYDWSRPEAFAASLSEQGVRFRLLSSAEPGPSRIVLY
jgi:transmembrane sensor